MIEKEEKKTYIEFDQQQTTNKKRKSAHKKRKEKAIKLIMVCLFFGNGTTGTNLAYTNWGNSAVKMIGRRSGFFFCINRYV